MYHHQVQWPCWYHWHFNHLGSDKVKVYLLSIQDSYLKICTPIQWVKHSCIEVCAPIVNKNEMKEVRS